MKKGAALALIGIIIISSGIGVIVLSGSMNSLPFIGPFFETPESESAPFETYEVDISEDLKWVGYDVTPPGTPAEAFVTLSDTTGLTVITEFHGFWRRNVTINGTTFDRIEIPGTGSIVDNGKPAVPRLTRFLEIPHGVDITLTVTYNESRTLEGFDVEPFQPQMLTLPNMTTPEFTMDPTIYEGMRGGVNVSYPFYRVASNGDLASSPIIMRGRRILELSVYPIVFTPKQNELRVFSSIEVRVNYDEPSQIEPVNASLWAESFERIFEGILLNYKNWGNPNYGVNSGESVSAHIDSHISASYPQDGAEYLIITDEVFREQAERLAAWKTRKGLFTQVWTTQEICTDPFVLDNIEIQTFIEDAYYYWSPAPTYVLLFGDSDFVPCLYEIEHPAMWFNGVTNIPVHGPEGQGQIGTDLMYFTVEGVDYLPEIIYGRISVEDDVTKDDANIIVNKIIEYERNPPMTPADEVFYSNILASAGYLDYEPPDDYEDEPYVSISEELREYLDSMYTIHRCYYGRKFDPDFDVDGEWIAPDVDSKLYDGTSRIENWYWDSTAANIEGNITEGRFFVFHIDHGTSKNFHWYLHPDPRGELSNNHFDGWSMPRYIDENAASLANGNYLPFVLNINCNNGWFDGEIDQDPENTNNINLVRSNDCFSENLTRKSGGGAIAAIGATRGSWSAPNGDLIKGITQALWPGILQSFANRPIYNMGAVLLFGKLIVEQKWHDDISQENIERKYSETTSHIYHLFGDPETPLWTELPSLLEVTYPSSIGTAEPQSFVVKVKDSASGAPLHYAKVCLQKDSEVFEVGYTNTHGYVTFNVRPLSGGPMNITVTMQNYKPEVAEIEVIESSATLDLIPTRSEVGLNVMITLTNFGDEIVDVYFESTLTTPQIVAVGGAFSQPRAIPITDLGPVYVQAIGQDSNRVAVKLLTLLSDEEGPDPYIYSQWDQTTWFLSDPPNLYWNNPCIQLYHEDGTPAQSNNLEVLQNYVIKACIHNDEDVVAENTIVTFTWTHFGGGQRTWDLIGTDQITIDAGQGSYAYAEVSWTPRKTGHSCLRVSVFHPRDERESNNIGQENTNVMPPVSSPGTVDFIVQNPLCRDSHFYLEVRQLMNDTDEISTWGSTVKGISPHALPMGSIASLTLEINAPSNASIGETRTFIVNVYIGGRLVGGISTQVVKGSQQIESPMLLIMTIAGISAGIAVLVVIVKKWKPDSSLLKKLKIGE